MRKRANFALVSAARPDLDDAVAPADSRVVIAGRSVGEVARSTAVVEALLDLDRHSPSRDRLSCGC